MIQNIVFKYAEDKKCYFPTDWSNSKYRQSYWKYEVNISSKFPQLYSDIEKICENRLPLWSDFIELDVKITSDSALKDEYSYYSEKTEWYYYSKSCERYFITTSSEKRKIVEKLLQEIEIRKSKTEIEYYI